MKLPTEIRSFKGDWDFLSSFYPCSVTLDGVVYPSTEHAYQAAKTLNPTLREKFLYAGVSAGAAKRMGSSLPLRADWCDEFKVEVMFDLLMQKFQRGSILYRKLLCTFSAELVEGNYWHDRWWGVCDGTCKQGPHAPEGLNYLGQLLMNVRSRKGTTGTIIQLLNPRIEGKYASLCDYQQSERKTVRGSDDTDLEATVATPRLEINNE